MKLTSFVLRGAPSWGVVLGSDLIDCGARFRDRWPTLRSALGDPAALAELADDPGSPDLRLADVTLLAAVPDPQKILCIGVNYEDHRTETGRAVAGQPTVFVRWPDSLVGSGASLVKPAASDEYDYEGELAIVIGRAGRHIREDDALDHVAGYSCFMDGSVRDWQRHTTQFTPGKNFPASGSLGPWVVTRDEVPDPQALRLTTRLNGNQVQSSSTELMIFGLRRLIAYASTFTSLAPGDVIATGTPGGVGSKRVPPLFMKPGDEIEVEIESVGSLRNRVVAE